MSTNSRLCRREIVLLKKTSSIGYHFVGAGNQGMCRWRSTLSNYQRSIFLKLFLNTSICDNELKPCACVHFDSGRATTDMHSHQGKHKNCLSTTVISTIAQRKNRRMCPQTVCCVEERLFFWRKLLRISFHWCWKSRDTGGGAHDLIIKGFLMLFLNTSICEDEPMYTLVFILLGEDECNTKTNSFSHSVEFNIGMKLWIPDAVLEHIDL